MPLTIDLQRCTWRLHLLDLLAQVRIPPRTPACAPVAEDHRQRRERRAQLVRRAGGEQAHAHDVLFLGRALAQVRQACASRSRRLPADARDEDHQQRRVDQEADQQALDVVLRIAVPAAAAGGASVRSTRRRT